MQDGYWAAIASQGDSELANPRVTRNALAVLTSTSGACIVYLRRHTHCAEEQDRSVLANASAIVARCILLESVATAAQVASPASSSTLMSTPQIMKGAFQPFIVTLLYRLLEQLGATVSVVSSTAAFCLDAIARHCGYGLVASAAIVIVYRCAARHRS